MTKFLKFLHAFYAILCHHKFISFTGHRWYTYHQQCSKTSNQGWHCLWRNSSNKISLLIFKQTTKFDQSSFQLAASWIGCFLKHRWPLISTTTPGFMLMRHNNNTKQSVEKQLYKILFHRLVSFRKHTEIQRWPDQKINSDFFHMLYKCLASLFSPAPRLPFDS